MIGNWQSAPPQLRSHRPTQRSQQRLGIAIGNWQNGDLGNTRCIFNGKTLRVSRRTDTRSEGVTGTGRWEIHYAAALNAVCRPHRSLRKYIVREVAIIGRIRVDQATNRPVFGRDFRLDPPPGFAVLDDDNRSLYRDPEPIQFFVILGESVIDENQRGGHVPVPRVRVVGWQLFVLLARCQISGNR